jgi:hypothetical protein
VCFPTTSNAARVFANSAQPRVLYPQPLSFRSASLRAGLPDLSATPAKAPASRARRHSMMCEEDKPSRRSNAPFAPGSVAASYLASVAPDGEVVKLCQLRYGGSASMWGFAIYRTSHDDYQPSYPPIGHTASHRKKPSTPPAASTWATPSAWT